MGTEEHVRISPLASRRFLGGGKASLISLLDMASNFFPPFCKIYLYDRFSALEVLAILVNSHG